MQATPAQPPQRGTEHQVKNLNPADWTYADSYYTGITGEVAEMYDWQSLHEICSGERCIAESKNEHAELAWTAQVARGDVSCAYKRLGGRCDHCGAFHAYGSIYKNAAGAWVQIGHTCARKWFSLPDRATYQKKQAEKLVHARAKRVKAYFKGLRTIIAAARRDRCVLAFLRSHDRFAKDLRASAFVWGWSVKQADAVVRAAVRAAEREAAKPIAVKAREELKPTAAAPEGRVDVTGVVVRAWTKMVASFGGYGGEEPKHMMKLHTDAGFQIICTIPASVRKELAQRTDVEGYDWNSLKGQRITMSVELNRAQDFGLAWGKRPTKASICHPVTT